MHSHRTLHALVTLLTLVLILTGPAAPTRSAQAETPPPPPPSRDSYTNWEGPTQALPRLPKDSAAAAQAPALNIVPQFNCNWPSRLDYAVIVFDAVRPDDPNYNDDIYMYTRPCIGVSLQYPVTTDPAADYMPRISNDTTKIVFVSKRDGNAEVYLAGIPLSGTQTRLTNDSSTDTMPTFSPDGKKIAFVSNRGGSANIYTMNLDGSGLKRLTNAGVNDLSPDWSPDGKQIAYVRRASDGINAALYVMNADGSNQHAILGSQRWMNRPVWSPSGKKLAFEYDPDGDDWFDLGTVNANGSGLTKLPVTRRSQINGYVTGIDFILGSWLPDETGLVYNAIESIYYESEWYTYSSFMYVYDISPRTDTLIGNEGYYYYPYMRNPDNIAPHSAIAPLPEYSRAGQFLMTVTASDDNLGLSTYQIQSRREQDTTWATSVSGYIVGYPLNFTGDMEVTLADDAVGQIVYFRSQFADLGGNYEAVKANPDAWTRVYRYAYNFLVTDVRDHPLTKQPVTLNPAAMNTLITGADGQVKAYMTNSSAFTQATYNRTGYGSLPVQTLPAGGDLSIRTVMPGSNEVLVNGYFNNATSHLTGWQTSGTIPVSSGQGMLYRGYKAIFGPCTTTNNPCAAGEATLSQAISLPANMYNPTLSFFYTPYGVSTSHSTFQVVFTPQNGQPATVFNQPAKSGPGIQHAWVDMTPYRGQTGTLTFRLNQTGSEAPSTVYLGEVSLSSWNTPFLTSAGPLSILAGAADGVWIDLDGENFAPTAQVFLGDLEITTLERTGSTHIRFQLPVGIANGPYDLHIVNPGGAEARPERPLWVGYFTYQPSVSR